MSGGCRAQVSLDLNLDEVDEADEDTFNRILWRSTRAQGARRTLSGPNGAGRS
jgi:hypothetical protein